MTWQILQADSRHLPVKDASVDLLVTSPPYFGLRSYRDGGEHYAGQIGSEPSPAEYVAELVGMIDGEWRRVLKPSGSMMLNLGDKMSGGRSGSSGWGKPRVGDGKNFGAAMARQDAELADAPVADWGARAKSLLGLPWRVALALIDRGWILRAEIIWSKPNGLPESVTDRVRRSHEQVFHLVLNPRYYSAVDEIRQEHAGGGEGMNKAERVERGQATRGHTQLVGALGVGRSMEGNPLGRLPGSVWTIPTQPLLIPDAVREHYRLTDHFAAYPAELVRRIILGWSPLRVCQQCGEGRRPLVERTPMEWTPSGRQDTTELRGPRPTSGRMDKAPTTSIIGEACACPTPDANTKPGMVLDPMCGTGTTVGVAHKLGRDAIGVDLSADYCRLARWRVGQSTHFDRIDQRTAAEQQGVLL
jgi:DNA modification methylase